MLHTISEIKDAATNGHSPYWFSASTLAFFDSNIHPEVYPVPGGALFISSERFDENSPRLFTVRHCTDNGKITTVGEFQEHGSLVAARMAAIARREARLTA